MNVIGIALETNQALISEVHASKCAAQRMHHWA